MIAKHPGGRPRSEHTERFAVRHSDSQMDQWILAAGDAGVELQTWIRDTLDAAAMKAKAKR
jgi:predicted HicB family RNase H-like nuclease